MPKTCLTFCLSLIVVIRCGTAVSQDVQPQIRVVHPGFEALTSDLLSLTELTGPDERQYGTDLKDFISEISIGMDGSRPFGIDVLTGSGPTSYLLRLPHAERELFLEQLESLYFEDVSEVQGPDLYLVDDGIDRGWLRFMAKSEYAVMALSTVETHQQTKERVLAANHSGPAFRQLEKLDASTLLTLSNTEHGEDSQIVRSESFTELRKDNLAELQQRPSESTSEFELRKGTRSIIYDELQRIYVEASEVNVWTRQDRENSTAKISFEAGGIANTSLAESIAQLGQRPDAFAGVQSLSETVMSGRLNHPIDSLRQQNASMYLDLLTTDVHNRIDNLATLGNAEKQATRTIFDDVVTLFRDGFASGNVNGFAEVLHDGTQFTLIGAVSAPGSERLTETLKQLPQARAGNTVVLDVASVDDITIHKISLSEGFVDLADDLFGVGREFLIGIGRDQVWLATGPDSLALLESKIGEAEDAETSDVVLSVDIRMAPWARRLNELAEQREKPQDVEERSAWRENLLRIRQLSQSLVTHDDLLLSVTRGDAKVSGGVHLDKGLLRFLGHQIARLAKENLEL